MRFAKYVAVVVTILMLSGCSSSCKTTCNEMTTLKADLAKAQQSLAQEKQAHQDEVQKLNAESAKMQTEAMTSITTMLSKDKALQDKLQATIDALKTEKASLLAQVKTLTDENAQLKAAAEPAPAADPNAK